jgi:hypothetical protein
VKCKCGEHVLVKRGRRYKRHVDQLGAGKSVDHSRETCMKFERGNAPDTFKSGRSDWTYEMRPQRMERIA